MLHLTTDVLFRYDELHQLVSLSILFYSAFIQIVFGTVQQRILYSIINDMENEAKEKWKNQIFLRVNRTPLIGYNQ